MSTGRGIYFLSKEITPTVEKIWEFIRQGELRIDFGLHDKEQPSQSYSRSGWIYPLGENSENYFEFSDVLIEYGYFPKFKVFAAFSGSNSTYHQKGNIYYYNYEAMEELVKFLRGTYLEDVHVVCFSNDSVTKPKALELWPGPKITKLKLQNG